MEVSSESMSDNDFESESIVAAAKSDESELIPHKYQNVYENFVKWKSENQTKANSEEVLLAYFNELSEKGCKPSSVWAYYSMLKAAMKVKDNTDISSYHKVSAFLKNKSIGYKPVKAKVFSNKEIDSFISDAPDNKWLDVKVACIFGICGALRTEELTRIKVEDIEKQGNLLLVEIFKTKTKVPRTFTITGHFYDLVQRYAALRCPRTTDSRFFVNYKDGKCTVQLIGKNKFSKMPKRIANFLMLPDADQYTGHSFRRSSVLLLANSGATMERIMRHDAWMSSKVAGRYVHESLNYEKEPGDQTTSPITSSTTYASQGYIQNDKDDSNIPLEGLPELSDAQDSFDSNDDAGLNRNHRTKAPKRKRKKRPKRQKEIDWYDEECLAQIKLTTDMFKRFSKMAEDDKMKMLSDFSKDRVELFKKYFAAMNTAARNQINNATNSASINTAAQNGRVTDSDGMRP